MEKKEIEYVLPADIEKRSFEIIAAELKVLRCRQSRIWSPDG